MAIRITNNNYGGRVSISSRGLGGRFQYVADPPPIPLLLDTYSGAAAAYSLRKLRTVYAGSAIRVRRSSDNTETDIGFNSSNGLDTTSLLSFIGYQNLLASPQDFNNAIWQKGATSPATVVTANVTTAPDGTTTADLITQTTAINLYQDYSNTNDSMCVFSCYLKKSTQSTCDLYLYRTNTGFLSQATFNLDTGTITAQQYGANAKIESVGNGWYRCSVTTTIGVMGITTGIYNTSSVYAWGAQLTITGYQQYTSTTNSNTGYITKWYDQSSNSRDAIQATTANQPYVIVADVRDKPSIFYRNPYELRTVNDATFLTNTAYTAFVVESQSTVGNDRYFLGVDYTGATSNSIVAIGYRSTSQVSIAHYSNDANFTFTSVTAQKLTSAIFKNTGSDYYINNASLGTSVLPTSAVTINSKLQIGRALGTGALYYYGSISEMIVYTTNQTSNLAAINSNINSYYTIY